MALRMASAAAAAIAVLALAPAACRNPRAIETGARAGAEAGERALQTAVKGSQEAVEAGSRARQRREAADNALHFAREHGGEAARYAADRLSNEQSPADLGLPSQ